jgi:sec-independent protein translocase protein TatA
MTFGIQPIHIVIVLVVALLVFGPKRLPEMGRSIGKMLNEFRNGTREITDGLRAEVNGSETGQFKHAAPPPTSSVAFQAPSSNLTAAPGKFCIQCGAGNLPEALYCNQCGSKLPENTILPSDPSILGRQTKANADPADPANVRG